jgi:uracil permease
MTRRAIGVSERPPLLQTIPLSLQHLFAMFGATVLVPILFHINPATVLLFNGLGTLLYLFICKGKIPAYLGSSFAFISPVLLLLPLGYEVALGGFIMCGVLFCLVSFIVKKAGTGWLDVMFPPAAMGAIVAVIGLELAGVAANMAGLLPADGQSPDSKTIIISLVTLGVTVFGSVLFRGFMAIIPILIGVLAGYALSFAMGVVDTTPIAQAHWFADSQPVGDLHRRLHHSAGDLYGYLYSLSAPWAQIPGKEEFYETLRYYRRMIELTGVELRLNQFVRAADLIGFDEVILASGIAPRVQV